MLQLPGLRGCLGWEAKRRQQTPFGAGSSSPSETAARAAISWQTLWWIYFWVSFSYRVATSLVSCCFLGAEDILGLLALTPGPGVPAAAVPQGTRLRGGEQSGHLVGSTCLRAPLPWLPVKCHLWCTSSQQLILTPARFLVCGTQGLRQSWDPAGAGGAGITVHLLERAGTFPVHRSWLPGGQKTFGWNCGWCYLNSYVMFLFSLLISEGVRMLVHTASGCALLPGCNSHSKFLKL